MMTAGMLLPLVNSSPSTVAVVVTVQMYSVSPLTPSASVKVILYSVVLETEPTTEPASSLSQVTVYVLQNPIHGPLVAEMHPNFMVD